MTAKKLWRARPVPEERKDIQRIGKDLCPRCGAELSAHPEWINQDMAEMVVKYWKCSKCGGSYRETKGKE